MPYDIYIHTQLQTIITNDIIIAEPLGEVNTCGA